MNGRYDDENLYVSKYRNGGGGGSGSDASDIGYDDTETQLHAVNVQQAIEALNTKCKTNSTNIETLTANKQDKLTAGTGISLNGAIISVSTSYDAVTEELTIGL